MQRYGGVRYKKRAKKFSVSSVLRVSRNDVGWDVFTHDPLLPKFLFLP